MIEVREQTDSDARPISRALLEMMLRDIAAIKATVAPMSDGRTGPAARNFVERYTRSPWRIDSVEDGENDRKRYSGTLQTLIYSESESKGYVDFPGPITSDRIYSDAEIGSSDAPDVAAGTIVWAYAVVTKDDDDDPVPELRFSPGGGGKLPTGQYVGQTYQVGSQNQAVWDFDLAHGLL